MKRIFTISGLVLLCFFFIDTAFAQSITIKGKVTDATTGESLVGVSISVKGTTNGTQTDVNGAYSINAPSAATLTFTYIGYASQSLIVNGRNTIEVKLQGQANELQQVVVIGYGTQRKLDNTGAVASVKGAEISKQASVNPVSSLQGKVAGVQITNAGSPGASPQVSIRGLGTVYGNTSPLFVVDGVWYSDISFLSPQDIENVTVLKDASSTAIYGIRAANGVILITTKRGVKGKPVINYNGYAGWQTATNQVKMANGTEYATAINELYAANGVTPPLFADPTSFGKGTDWYGRILQSGFVMNHALSLSGGTEKYTYNYSFGYLDQDGLVKTNNYKRYTAHLSNDFKPSKSFKFGYTASGLFSNSRDIDGGIFHQLYGVAPTLPVYYKDGKYGDPADYHTGDGNNYNPQATLDFYNHKSKNYRVTGNVYAEVSILKDLKFKTSFGGDIAQAEARGYTPLYAATLAQKSTATNLDVNHTETRNWIWENTLTYDYRIKQHKITALLGYSAQNNRTDENDGHQQNVPYTSKGNLHSSFPDNGSGAVYFADPGLQIHTRALSQFARINYSFADRYLLNASIRRDGASQFYGKGNQTYGYFPSVGAGWVVTNEPFMKEQHVFDNLKIRGSWGKVGNSVVPINPSVQVVDRGQNLTAIFGNPPQAYPGGSIDQFVPPTIVWEKAVASDFGIEGSLLNNKLTFEADYYNRKTQDAIFAIPILLSAGGSGSIIGNQADISNKGFEFVLGWKDQVSKEASYSISANLGINTNKVLNVLTGKNPIYSGGNGIANGALATRTVVGEPIGEFYGYKVTGIFQTPAEVASSKQTGAKPGDFIYEDVNKDGVFDSRDKTAIGNPNAKYAYGINTSVTYKQFDLAIDFQGIAGVDVYNANIAYRFGNENFTKDFFDHRWHGAGTSNTYPSVTVGANSNAAPNSFYVESGAYFRVRNAQLGYTLPGSLTSKWKISKVRLYANAQNAINIFGYKGFTPEVGGGVGNRGIDANVYPLYATYNFGVNVTF